MLNLDVDQGHPSGGRKARYAITLTIAILAVVVLCSAGVSHLRKGTLLQTATSPDGEWSIEVYFIDAGATDGGTLRVMAQARDGKPREVARFGRLERITFSRYAYGDDYPGQIELEWLGGNEARIGGYPVDLSSDHIEDY